MLRSVALRLALGLADRLAWALPAGLADRLAQLAGRTWYRLAPGRRQVVGENLRRVVAGATGRDPSANQLRRLTRAAFVHHARYYLDVLRAPHYTDAAALRRLEVVGWDGWEPVLRRGAVIALPHLGSMEVFGRFMAAQGIQGVAPIEEIEPPELYEFLTARRAAQHTIRIVPVQRARRPMLEALRAGHLAALVADRNLGSDGLAVEFFGRETTVPTGPAALALLARRPLLAAATTWLGVDRYRAEGWLVWSPEPDPANADDQTVQDLPEERSAAVRVLTEALVRRFETAIARAPEQWWASFQTFWSDQREEG